ncbi:MAG: hypothetical protein AAB895_00160 [Patescibacteria group bacterium]
MIPWRYQKILLETLASDPKADLVRACQKAHISRATLYRLFKKDPVFKIQVENAIDEGKSTDIGVEAAEALTRRARAGHLPSIKFLMKFTGF